MIKQQPGVRQSGRTKRTHDATFAEVPAAAPGPRQGSGVGRRVRDHLAAIHNTYRDVRAAWRAGAHLPPSLPLRDYPIARR